MNAHDRDHQRSHKHPAPPRNPMAMVVEDFAQRDPIAATRALAHGLAIQTPGSQVAALRILAAMLCRREPSLAAEIANDLRGLCPAEGDA